jgi:hypothetical protein
LLFQTYVTNILQYLLYTGVHIEKLNYSETRNFVDDSSNVTITISFQVKLSLYRPRRLQKVAFPELSANWHMEVARMSVLRTGRLYSQGKIPGTYFC